MPGKIALRIAQLLLLTAVGSVLLFGRKSTTLSSVSPAAIQGGAGSGSDTSIVLRREPSRRALPYTRKLIPVPNGPQSNPVAAPTATASLPPKPVTSAEIANDRQVRRHRIVEGDSIRSIAQKYLGDPDRAEEIFLANRHLLDEPEVLPLGEYLIIAPAASASTGRSSGQYPLPASSVLLQEDRQTFPARPLLPVQ